ncbi:MAG TPA: DUF2927 domain-containing protein [Afifellaceae bacterium]|nr:DUF2927 domain-containing protein [Afifellaceae bacterium]
MRLLLLLFVLALTLFPARIAQAVRFSDEQLINSFNSTVFGAEYSSWGLHTRIVKKFAKPVRVYIDNRSRLDRRRAVRKFVRSLPRSIKGIRITIVDDPDDANYVIYVVDRNAYKDVVRNEVYRRRTMNVPGRCLVRVISSPSGIRRSDAVIVSDEGEFLFRRCLVEEVLQGLGPVNDNKSLTYSVFNDTSKHDRFTRHDRYILNMLYDKRIKPGMSLNEVSKILPAVIRDARRRVH